jgi:hypothetical protein
VHGQHEQPGRRRRKLRDLGGQLPNLRLGRQPILSFVAWLEVTIFRQAISGYCDQLVALFVGKWLDKWPGNFDEGS